MLEKKTLVVLLDLLPNLRLVKTSKGKQSLKLVVRTDFKAGTNFLAGTNFRDGLIFKAGSM